MTDITPIKAVIYSRVSSVKQVTRGDGLGSQETRCREYAGYKGYDVIEVFRDEGVSGGLIDRPDMKRMLTFLRKHSREEPIAVIIDDISRLARGLDAHIKLRGAIGSVGGLLESPSIEFGDDSDSILVENLLASVSQHARQKNAEQVVNRMRARVLNGYWCFGPPMGYKFEKVAGHGKLLVRHEPVASIVQEALEGHASGRFGSQAEIKRFLEASPAFPKNDHQEVHFRRVEDLIKQPLYAGYINVSKWDIHMQAGKHEPLISLETYQKIQALKDDNTSVPVRIDVSEDFPLRGFVRCDCCNRPMTAAFSKGRSKRYGYYFCQTRGCDNRRKNIKKEKIESEFSSLLESMTPSRELFVTVFHMLEEWWHDRESKAKTLIATAKSDGQKIDRKLSQLMGRILETDSQTMVSAYESEVKKLEMEKLLLLERIQQCGRPATDFKQTYRTAMEFLGNPQKLWDSERLEDKRLAVKLTFGPDLRYGLKQGYRTAESTIPFKALAAISGQKKEMVGPEGLEPPTNPL
ncbi:recombinase family protein [Roseibium album]|uniref:recombinase family protein n=1 Tax=Roseibium album TaxID=311410 RepID=UPI00329A0663